MSTTNQYEPTVTMTAATVLEVGAMIDDYQITALLGAGGMGQVYKARNLISGRVEAIKALLPNLETDAESVGRFIREIRLQAALDHPHIARMYTSHRFHSQILMFMEYVEGTTVQRQLKRGAFSKAAALDCIYQVLSALAYAHSHDVIHRDIKPANMMISANGSLKLMDFGIARLAAERSITQMGTVIGTVNYMSPEQIEGLGKVDGRSDLYSVGIVLYELLTGRPPFHGNLEQTIMAHLSEAPTPPIEFDPSIGPELNNIVLKAIAKKPDDRFQSADEFHSALQTLAGPATAVEPEIGSGRSGSKRHINLSRLARHLHPPAVGIPIAALLAFASVMTLWDLSPRTPSNHGVAAPPVVLRTQAKPETTLSHVEPQAPVQAAEAIEEPAKPLLQSPPEPAAPLIDAFIPDASPALSRKKSERQAFVPPAKTASAPPPVLDMPPDISSDVRAETTQFEAPVATPGMIPARHMHFLGRGAAGWLKVSGEGYRFEEAKSPHTFEGVILDIMADCGSGKEECDIKIMRGGRHQVLRVKVSDWMAVQPAVKDEQRAAKAAPDDINQSFGQSSQTLGTGLPALPGASNSLASPAVSRKH